MASLGDQDKIDLQRCIERADRLFFWGCSFTVGFSLLAIYLLLKIWF